VPRNTILKLALAALVVTPAATSRAQTTRPTAAPAATQPTAAARPPAAPAFSANASQREDQFKDVIDAPDWGTVRIADLIHFSLVDGRLESEWVGKSTNREPKRMRVEGSDATWLLNHVATTNGAFYSLKRFLFEGHEEDFWMVEFNTQEGLGTTTVIAQGGDACDVAGLAYSQSPTGITLMLTRRGVNRRRLITAPDLDELRRKHPNEACWYLLPILRQMTGQPILRPGGGDVYRVFTDIPADPAVTAQIDQLLPALAATDAQERDRATLALYALGRPGALAALRYDTESLIPEQRTRLQTLVARNAPLALDDPAAAARDPNFLIECLEDRDPAVRTGAKTLLEQALGHKVDFDPAAPADRRAAAATTLRTTYAHTTLERQTLENLHAQ
jgi:hypothetical protein